MEAAGKLRAVQAALAVEAAEKILSRLFPFLRVAFHTARDQIAIGIVAGPRLRHHVVEAPHGRSSPAQTIEAVAALPRVDGLAQRHTVQKICFFDFDLDIRSHFPWDIPSGEGARRSLFDITSPFDTRTAHAGNLIWQAHLNYMAGIAALDDPQSAIGGEPAHRVTHRHRCQPDIARQPHHREAKALFPFEAAVPQEMRIDSALNDRQAQPGDDLIFQLFPDKCSVWFVFHVRSRVGIYGSWKVETSQNSKLKKKQEFTAEAAEVTETKIKSQKLNEEKEFIASGKLRRQRLAPGGECGAKRKRAKPRFGRRFTRVI